VSLGKVSCHSLDLGAAGSDHAAENGVREAEPAFTFTFTFSSGAEQHGSGREPVRELFDKVGRSPGTHRCHFAARQLSA
jgi:hypothetical protein